MKRILFERKRMYLLDDPIEQFVVKLALALLLGHPFGRKGTTAEEWFAGDNIYRALLDSNERPEHERSCYEEIWTELWKSAKERRAKHGSHEDEEEKEG